MSFSHSYMRSYLEFRSPVIVITVLLANEPRHEKKPVYTICEQQRRRSACASAQSDQHLCCSLPRKYNISSFYIRNFKPLASFCGCVGWFESYLVENHEDRFSRDEAQMVSLSFIVLREECQVHLKTYTWSINFSYFLFAHHDQILLLNVKNNYIFNIWARSRLRLLIPFIASM